MTSPELNEDLVLLWQLAKEMATGSSDTREECWLELMRAFWSGDFAPNGLMLWQTDTNEKSGVKFEELTRFDLALAALGSREFKELGAEVACRELMNWNVESYAKIKGFRYVSNGKYDRLDEPGNFYYFSTAEPQRGLCVNRSELDQWQEKLKKTASSLEKQSTRAPSRNAPKFSAAIACIKALWPDGLRAELDSKVRNRQIQAEAKKRNLSIPLSTTIKRAVKSLSSSAK